MHKQDGWLMIVDIFFADHAYIRSHFEIHEIFFRDLDHGRPFFVGDGYPVLIDNSVLTALDSISVDLLQLGILIHFTWRVRSTVFLQLAKGSLENVLVQVDCYFLAITLLFDYRWL